MPLHLPPFYHLVPHDRLASTNDEARRLAEEGATEGTLVWALEQTAGRGRRGRRWVSPPGNLYLSLVLRPRCTVAVAAQLGFAAAVAVGDACARWLSPAAGLRYKWPNDVLLDDRKLAGVLMASCALPSAALDWAVLGIGVNVTGHPVETEWPATSLAAAGLPRVAAEVMLEAVAEAFLPLYVEWRTEGFAPLRRRWLARAHPEGTRLKVRLAGETFVGAFAGLDGEGALLVDSGGERRRIAAGDVFPAAQG